MVMLALGGRVCEIWARVSLYNLWITPNLTIPIIVIPGFLRPRPFGDLTIFNTMLFQDLGPGESWDSSRAV